MNCIDILSYMNAYVRSFVADKEPVNRHSQTEYGSLSSLSPQRVSFRSSAPKIFTPPTGRPLLTNYRLTSHGALNHRQVEQKLLYNSCNRSGRQTDIFNQQQQPH